MSVRVNSANRKQLYMDIVDYNIMIPENHTARIITSFVDKIELNDFYMLIKSRESQAGRPATDPRLILCLWIYATVQGIGSARTIERQCRTDNAYRWICGGVSVNHHTLSDFRTSHPQLLDNILTNIVSSLVKGGIVSLKNVVFDGTKTKANAGKQSFKTKKQLHRLQRQTKHYVEALRQEVHNDPQASDRRIKAAQDRVKREAHEKVKRALSVLPEIEALKEQRKKKVKKTTKVSKAKVSTTDPDARLMKFRDGSIKAGYNCQIGIDADTMIILGVDPSQQGNDAGLLKPMVEEIDRKYGKRPERAIVDSGYRVEQDILDLAEASSPTLTYSPLAKQKKDITPESLRRRLVREEKKPAAIQAFKKRMSNKSTRFISRLRTRIETVNGILHNRKTTGFHLRGKNNVKSELLLFAIGYNIMTIHKMEQNMSI